MHRIFFLNRERVLFYECTFADSRICLRNHTFCRVFVCDAVILRRGYFTNKCISELEFYIRSYWKILGMELEMKLKLIRTNLSYNDTDTM